MKNKYKILTIFLVTINFLIGNNLKADIALYEIEGKKINYQNNNNIIIAEGDAKAEDKLGRKIFADKIIYNKTNSIITTTSKSIYKDQKGNTLNADTFIYEINKKIIKANHNVKFIDKSGYVFNFSQLTYNLENEKGFGKNFIGKLIDKSSIDSDFAEFDNKNGILTTGEKKINSLLDSLKELFGQYSNSYTTCEIQKETDKKIQENCPDWSINTQKTIHDNKNKMVYHYNTLIKIKNIPVFYTPYFEHPSPDVKRKSGFLNPDIKNFSNLGQTIKLPYFFEINKNEDLTFSPIYYFDENPIFLVEYRKQNTNSRFYIDSSYTEGYKNLTKKDSAGNLLERTRGSRNHFFLNFNGSYDDLLFSKNDVEINIQRISQKNYLNVNEINTNYIKSDIRNLQNNFLINSYKENQKLSFESKILEDLNNEDKNTKYQYIYPEIKYSNFFDKFNQYINLNNQFSIINTGGDTNKTNLVNKIDTVSKQYVNNEFGLTNTFKTSINNINNYNQNVSNEKNDINSDFYLTAALENSYPLIKLTSENGNKKEETIMPKLLTKFTSGSTKNINDKIKILQYEDIHSMNRLNEISNPETGMSFGYGVEYEQNTKNIKNEIFSKTKFSIGQILSPTNRDELPTTSTLNNKRSAYVGNISYFFNAETKDLEKKNKNLSNEININYNYIVSNNFHNFYQNSLDLNLKIENNTFSSKFYETNKISEDHYVEFKYEKNFNNDINIYFGGRKNIQQDFTENNFIGTKYETDCLRIALDLSKNFYQNEEAKASNRLFLNLTLKPFGSAAGANLSSFLN